MSARGTAGTGRIPTLDGWRAVAILLVLVAHVPSRQAYGDNLPAWIIGSGTLGVSLFFAISGYLITSRLLSEYAGRGGISLRNFYIRRAFRILPPALVYLGVMLALQLAGPAIGFLSCLFFFSNYVPYHLRSLPISHFWSLSMEEQFYLLWPPLLALAGLRRSAVVLASICLLIIPWRMWVFSGPLPGLALSERTDLRLDAFAFPCLLALLALKRPGSLRWITPWSGIAAGILALVLVKFGGKNAAYSALALLLPVLILSTVFHPRTWLSRILEFKPLAQIGRLSYSLYLWQQVFCFAFNLPLILRVGFSFAAATASYLWLEKPLQQKGRDLTRQRPKPPTAGDDGLVVKCAHDYS